MKSTGTLSLGLASASLCLQLWGCQIGEPTFMGGPCPEPNVDTRALPRGTVGAEAAPQVAPDRFGGEPNFIPYDTPPAMSNRNDVQDLLACFYPTELKDDKVGGRVELWLYVAEDGSVGSSEVKTSSGHAQLDQAAVSVGYYMYFRPARNKGELTAVWVSQWVTFEAR